MRLRLNIITASTRPGRIGPMIVDWFYGLSKDDGTFDVDSVDLAAFELPVYDEPRHPRLCQYEHEHTRRWSASVMAADAYVFVTPEYNFGPTPALINALNYVYMEWNYKPAAFVSYGGVSGGMRGVQMTKQTLTTLKMVPIMETVTIPMVAEHLKDGKFVPSNVHTQSASTLLKELHRWAEALKTMRTNAEMS